jgi:hypothetical protein
LRGEPSHATTNASARRLLSAHLTSLHLHLHHAARGRQGFSGTKTRKCDIGLGAKPRQIQGRDRPPTGVLPSPFPHAIIFQASGLLLTAIVLILLGNCHHPARLYGSQCSCMFVLVHSCASQSVVTDGQGSQDQAVQITVRSWPSRIHAPIVRRAMLEEGQRGSTAFLSVAGQSRGRERGGTSVVMILLLPTTAS